MTDENARKKYEHLKGLIAGKVKTGNPVRDDLIVSDATLNLADLIKKRPNIDFEEVKDFPDESFDLPPEERKPKTKSKEKK